MTQQFSTWPAPPTSSAWGPPLVCVPASRIRPAVRPPVKPQDTPPPRRRPRAAPEPDLVRLEGIVTRFGVFHTPRYQDDQLPADTLCTFAPGALDRSLRSIQRGLTCVPLTAGHDGPVITTTEKALELFIRDDELRFRIFSDTRDGRIAMKAIEATGWKGLSIGARRCKFARLYVGGLPTATIKVLEAEIFEVALCFAGGCPGCRLLPLRNCRGAS